MEDTGLIIIYLSIYLDTSYDPHSPDSMNKSTLMSSFYIVPSQTHPQYQQYIQQQQHDYNPTLGVAPTPVNTPRENTSISTTTTTTTTSNVNTTNTE